MKLGYQLSRRKIEIGADFDCAAHPATNCALRKLTKRLNLLQIVQFKSVNEFDKRRFMQMNLAVGC